MKSSIDKQRSCALSLHPYHHPSSQTGLVFAVWFFPAALAKRLTTIFCHFYSSIYPACFSLPDVLFCCLSLTHSLIYSPYAA
ncbi:hypothetical protein HDK64DRAFT_53173 [Phyllosticta capitalensis]